VIAIGIIVDVGDRDRHQQAERDAHHQAQPDEGAEAVGEKADGQAHDARAPDARQQHAAAAQAVAEQTGHGRSHREAGQAAREHQADLAGRQMPERRDVVDDVGRVVEVVAVEPEDQGQQHGEQQMKRAERRGLQGFEQIDAHRARRWSVLGHAGSPNIRCRGAAFFMNRRPL